MYSLHSETPKIWLPGKLKTSSSITTSGKIDIWSHTIEFELTSDHLKWQYGFSSEKRVDPRRAQQDSKSVW